MFWQFLINGLSIGSVYALISIGYNMVYGILNLLNFAHGDLYTIGVFIVFMMVSGGSNVALAILAAIVVTGLLNLVVERVAYRPVRFSGRVTPTISAVGVAYICRNFIQQVWGPQTHPFSISKLGTIHIGNIVLGQLQIVILVIAIALMLTLTLLLNKTKIGQAVTSISQSIPTASLMGIPANRIISIVYAMGAILGLIGGILYAAYYENVYFGMGFMNGTMKAWMACIIGGIGSLKGGIIGAIVLGLAENLISGYISTTYRDAFVWGLLMIFILVFPRGLFPARISEKI
ncbi:MAG: branched-chain amino acid ABC transporter permease [Dehalobacterium sp.]